MKCWLLLLIGFVFYSIPAKADPECNWVGSVCCYTVGEACQAGIEYACNLPSGTIKVGGISGISGRVEEICAPTPTGQLTHARIRVRFARENLQRSWCGRLSDPVPYGQVSLGGTLYSTFQVKQCRY